MANPSKGMKIKDPFKGQHANPSRGMEIKDPFKGQAAPDDQVVSNMGRDFIAHKAAYGRGRRFRRRSKNMALSGR